MLALYGRHFLRTNFGCRLVSLSSLSPAPSFQTLETQTDMREAVNWINQFRTAVIARSDVDLSFSRSSGPGGQNVNKVNTKATIRCPLERQWIPQWARPKLIKTPAYAASSRSLVLSSTLHRSQSQNVEDCLSKLHALVLSASLAAIKKEPSEAQKERVRGLERIANARRKAAKSQRSQVKRGRSNMPWD